MIPHSMQPKKFKFFKLKKDNPMKNEQSVLIVASPKKAYLGPITS